MKAFFAGDIMSSTLVREIYFLAEKVFDTRGISQDQLVPYLHTAAAALPARPLRVAGARVAHLATGNGSVATSNATAMTLPPAWRPGLSVSSGDDARGCAVEVLYELPDSTPAELQRITPHLTPQERAFLAPRASSLGPRPCSSSRTTCLFACPCCTPGLPSRSESCVRGGAVLRRGGPYAPPRDGASRATCVGAPSHCSREQQQQEQLAVAVLPLLMRRCVPISCLLSTGWSGLTCGFATGMSTTPLHRRVTSAPCEGPSS